MASVVSKTSIKIDDLINDTVVSGYMDPNGHLILVTRGEVEIDAGFIQKPFGEAWSPENAYVTGDIIGYGGALWKALSDNLDKVPTVFSSIWIPLFGRNSSEWVEQDPLFTGDDPTVNWNFSYKTGTSVVAPTAISGEYETGIQALKVSMSAASSQRMFQRTENLVKGGDIYTVLVRAKLLTAATGVTLDSEMLQNDADDLPEPGATGLVTVVSDEGERTLTTTWESYAFTLTAANGHPRAVMNLIAGTTGSAGVVLIDSVKVYQGLVRPIVHGRWSRTTNQTIPAATITKVSFNAAQDGPVGGLVLTSGTDLTVPYSGVYSISAGVSFAPATTNRRTILIQVNGTYVRTQDIDGDLPVFGTNDISTTLRLTPSDVVSIAVYQNVGSSLAIEGDAARNFLDVTLIGGGNVLNVDGGGAVASAITVQDEGVDVVAEADKINFVGPGVTVTDTGFGQATVTIPGGGGSGSSLPWAHDTFSANGGAQNFWLSHIPADYSEDVKWNGLGQLRTTDFTRSGSLLSILETGLVLGDKIDCQYQYTDEREDYSSITFVQSEYNRNSGASSLFMVGNAEIGDLAVMGMVGNGSNMCTDSRMTKVYSVLSTLGIRREVYIGTLTSLSNFTMNMPGGSVVVGYSVFRGIALADVGPIIGVHHSDHITPKPALSTPPHAAIAVVMSSHETINGVPSSAVGGYIDTLTSSAGRYSLTIQRYAGTAPTPAEDFSFGGSFSTDGEATLVTIGIGG